MSNQDNWQERTMQLIGKDAVNKLNNSNVAVIGIGGVGGYVAEMLVRAGLGKITIMDFDCVSVTNINRQIIATTQNVGQKKVDVMEKRLLEINPKCVITKYNCKFDETSKDIILSQKFDFVVDAIDMVTSKILLATICSQNNIPLISAMGAGNRYGIPHFEVLDIYKTQNDGLARIMRKKLKEAGVKKLPVVCTKELACTSANRIIGSISYYPAMCGCVIASYVINQIIK